MTNLLVTLLTPIASSFGVSAADLQSNVEKLSSYLAVIFIALIAMIVVLIVAVKVKKGFKHVVRTHAVVAFVLVTAIVVNVICYGPMKANVAGALNASKAELSEETVAQSRETIKKVGEEGMVLVKNNGVLPLEAGNINVFGWASTNPIFGGTGSGSSDSSTAVNILGSLKDAGFTTNEELSKMYTDYRADRPVVAMGAQDWTLPEPTMDSYTDELMGNAKEFSDTAVIVIGRSGGENADLPTDMKAVIDGTWDIRATASVVPDNYNYFNSSFTNNGDYDEFDEGDHYLQLSNTEEMMVEKVCSEFSNVIVVINANNAMELDWVDNYEQIGAVILCPGAGASGFAALGEIMNGSVNPSGRTVDTYVKDLTKTPTWNNAGAFIYNNMEDFQQDQTSDPAYEGSIAFVNYVEGIYVGYKFYETAADVGFIDYNEYVQYPFGYGLSYTTFEKTMDNFTDNGDSVSFDVTVTNTGDVAGKDVVEIYFNPPYTEGGIEKATVNLIDFAKTDLLEPGASQTISFNLPKEDMASYDDGIKVAGGGYILEAGDYTVSVRSDSHTVIAEATFTVDADVTGRSSDLVPAVNQFQDYSRGDFVQLSRAGGFANYAEATAAPAPEAYAMSAELRAAVEPNTNAYYDPTTLDNPDDVMPTLGAQNGLKLADLTGKAYDDPMWDQLLDQLTFEDMAMLINIGGWQTVAIESVGKVATSDCDGPAGLNNFITQCYGTAYPAEVLMAQTWNKDLAYEIGVSMGAEYAEVNNYGWYGPAMNTHRTAFAGRNFEYYSEDGVLAGYMAAYEINGAATHGIYAYMKHFALNDQEINRCAMLLTFASEQAIREVYLKAFELPTKLFEGTTRACMSSFNWIGSVPSCTNGNLLINVLRNEWGFVGMVETDYNGSYGYMNSDRCVRNGNDLMLGFGAHASNQFTDTSATATLAMRQACKNILYTVGNSGYYTSGDAVGGMDNMTKTFLTVDLAIAAVLIAVEAFVLVRYNKKNKAAK